MTADTTHWSAWHHQAPRKSVAIGAVVQQDNRILLVRHTYGALRGQWSFPTGFAEPSESPDVTALRETREEARMQRDRFARKIVAFLAPSLAARSRRLMGNPLGHNYHCRLSI